MKTKGICNDETWSVHKGFDHRSGELQFNVCSNNSIVAVCNPHFLRTPNLTICEANACLISSAPEMFKALLECEVLLDEYPLIKRQVKNALKKAEGKL